MNRFSFYPLTFLLALAGLFFPAISHAAPELAWTTYFGGSTGNVGQGIALDKQGNIYVTGYTYSSDGWTSGPVGNSLAGGMDGFVAKIAPDGTLLWSLSLGGDLEDEGRAIAIDQSGNIFIAGDTQSAGWISGGYDTNFNGQNLGNYLYNTFVVKTDPNGQHLWSTYLGGDYKTNDRVSDICLDLSGNPCVAGLTCAPEWLTGGFDITYGGNIDGFVCKIKSNGQFGWGTYLGRDYGDAAQGIDIDQEDNILVTGITQSTGWLSGEYDNYTGPCGFVLKMNSNGQVIWSSYLTTVSQGNDIAADNSGNIIITGYTMESGWASGGYDTSFNGSPGDRDAYVIKLSGNGQLLWSTFVGGNDRDSGNSVATDIAGNIYVTGFTFSRNWVLGGFDTVKDNGDDTFIVRISPEGQHIWSSYLASSAESDTRNYLSLDTAGNIFLAGYHNSDALVAKILVAGSLCVYIEPPAAATAGAHWRRVGTIPWFASGAMESDLTSGTHTVEFKPAYGWAPPPSQLVTIVKGQTTETTGTYTKQNTIAPGDWMKY